ncbi:hypothetical protein M569_13740, partial [Genlisea aurea]
YSHGGRWFWIHNTGPTGCLPYVMDRIPITAAEVDRTGCAVPVNEAAQYFNGKLKETVIQLREELTSAALTYVEVYSVKYELIANARKHGFVHPLRACCGHGGKYNYSRRFGCGSTIRAAKGKEEILVGKSCRDPSVVINWDGVHYTQAANHWVFNRISTGNYSDPPNPLTAACRR